ncbi:MAG: acetate/propionate family kinase, partial [Fibromonadaceae bacterium]|nr:acetate/propionate family kinase [Fibromonadaceae bacterium]
SSVKFAVIDTDSAESSVSGLVEEIGVGARFKAKRGEESFEKKIEAQNHSQALAAIQNFFRETGEDKGIVAVGHRVVHGGEKFSKSVLINGEVLKAVEEYSILAPLHNPPNLQGIAAAKNNFPELPQVAVFDTAFHQSIPDHAYLYGLPYYLYKEHKIRRYGFHGSSFNFVSKKTAELLNRDLSELCLIIAHLGNGCSAAAVKFGESADTTMGLTPLEGLVMGTRSGSVDPGIILHLNRTLGYDLEKLEKLLNKKSGLLGLSGISSDMRILLEAADGGSEDAKIAIEVFCYRLAREIASLVPALPKLDALVFTGGIGENSEEISKKTLSHLGFFKFGKPEHPQVLVVKTNEELLIAMDTEEVINGL